MIYSFLFDLRIKLEDAELKHDEKTIIEDGIIARKLYSLINTETIFDYFNIQLTGISAEMGTEQAHISANLG